MHSSPHLCGPINDKKSILSAMRATKLLLLGKTYLPIGSSSLPVPLDGQ